MNDYHEQILEGIKKLNDLGWKDMAIYWAYSNAIDKLLLKSMIESLHHE